MSLHTIYDQITLTFSTTFYGYSEAMKETMDSIWNADLSNLPFGATIFCVFIIAVIILKDFIQERNDK